MTDRYTSLANNDIVWKRCYVQNYVKDCVNEENTKEEKKVSEKKNGDQKLHVHSGNQNSLLKIILVILSNPEYL